ncbi:MAG TPA: acyl-CoA dehydrogenase family protein, partial [Dongiaceae bacterium]
MDFALPPETEALRRRIADFVAAEIMPLETDRANYDEHENIALPVLEALRAKVKAAGLWAPQMPRELGGLGLNVSAMAACYEAMGRSIFGPAAFNCAAPDDGNMILLARTGTAEQRQRWLMPI